MAHNSDQLAHDVEEALEDSSVGGEMDVMWSEHTGVNILFRGRRLDAIQSILDRDWVHVSDIENGEFGEVQVTFRVQGSDHYE